jgi:hypothetical protein
MAQRKTSNEKAPGLTVLARRNGERHIRLGPRNGGSAAKLDKPSIKKVNARLNNYTSAIELNQSGKYAVRIRAAFGRSGWVLPAFFLASSLDNAIKKLEQAMQSLQRHEERLWFWSVERSDDPNLAGELLEEFGLRLDRRSEFPGRAASLSVPPERAISGFFLAPVRRWLAESAVESRPVAARPHSGPSRLPAGPSIRSNY